MENAMIMVGERINTGFKDVKAAVLEKNGTVIKEWARKQTAAKASYLDVNLGAVSRKPEDLIWMIEQVQSVVDTPISIDNNKPMMLKAAMPVCKKPPLINSVTASEAEMNEIFPLVFQYKASVIGLSIDETGSPTSADKRVENAARVFEKAMEFGLQPEQLFLDPIVMPLKFTQPQASEIIKAAAQFRLFSDPPCHIICGLSNVSNGAIHKKLINRVFVAMMVANGLDAVILDVMDQELVDTILTAELIMNKGIYADSYLEAFRS
jgi:5-methyltetrahydrofolate corrinoid/iron sulfur protein methyltransferase